jgi:hypothetical protein
MQYEIINERTLAEVLTAVFFAITDRLGDSDEAEIQRLIGDAVSVGLVRTAPAKRILRKLATEPA